MSVQEHKRDLYAPIRCKIVTVSDTRTIETDKSGYLIKTYLESARYPIIAYEIVTDDKAPIAEAIFQGCQSEQIDVVLVNGGTGIAKRDVTIEAIQPLLEKEIVGFGELFRMLSYTDDIGSAALLSRAIAGVINKTAVFCMPGSSGAVKLAMEKLIMPELVHVVREIKK